MLLINFLELFDVLGLVHEEGALFVFVQVLGWQRLLASAKGNVVLVVAVCLHVVWLDVLLYLDRSRSKMLFAII